MREKGQKERDREREGGRRWNRGQRDMVCAMDLRGLSGILF